MDLDLGDAAAEVSHQAASGAGVAQPCDAGGRGLDAEQLERSGGFAVGVLAEDERGADEVADATDVLEALGGEQDGGVVGAREAHEPVDHGATLRGGQQEPRLVEHHHLVARAVDGHQAQRERGDEREGGDRDALGTGVGLARNARLGQRQPRGTDRAPQRPRA